VEEGDAYVCSEDLVIPDEVLGEQSNLGRRQGKTGCHSAEPNSWTESRLLAKCLVAMFGPGTSGYYMFVAWLSRCRNSRIQDRGYLRKEDLQILGEKVVLHCL
jgi:hypothetical protein